MILKTIAIHQPNYLPWAGYFLKMAACDVFVVHDNVQITKRGPTRRVKIHSKNTLDKTQWLTVPLKKHSDYTLIKDLEISWEVDWTKKHLNQIKDAYIQRTYFDDFFPLLVEWYQEVKALTSLSLVNVFFIKKIMQELNIKKEIIYSSSLPVSGKGTDYNIAVCQYLNASRYLSGKGGENYQREESFEAQQLKMTKLDSKNELLGMFSDFDVNVGLSIIELLMKLGKDEIKNRFLSFSV